MASDRGLHHRWVIFAVLACAGAGLLVSMSLVVMDVRLAAHGAIPLAGLACAVGALATSWASPTRRLLEPVTGAALCVLLFGLVGIAESTPDILVDAGDGRGGLVALAESGRLWPLLAALLAGTAGAAAGAGLARRLSPSRASLAMAMLAMALVGAGALISLWPAAYLAAAFVSEILATVMIIIGVIAALPVAGYLVQRSVPHRMTAAAAAGFPAAIGLLCAVSVTVHGSLFGSVLAAGFFAGLASITCWGGASIAWSRMETLRQLPRTAVPEARALAER